MSIISIIVIAIALSIDSFTVSIVNGCTFKNISIKKYFDIALIVSGFHIMMLLIGWLAGNKLGKIIFGLDHWIAFSLLSIIGLKMIYEGFKKRNTSNENDLTMPLIIGQAFATSIDALAIGISFAFLKIMIISPLLIIGIITFLFTLIGIYIGCNYCKLFFERFDIIGGLILIGIGIKILIEHLYL